MICILPGPRPHAVYGFAAVAKQLQGLSEKLAEVEGQLEEKFREVPHAENALEIPGIGDNILSGIIAEMGDVARFDEAGELIQKAKERKGII